MNKIYLLAAALFCSAISAQQTISFESAEGYALGNINNQNGWTVTDTSDGPLANQIVNDVMSKSGNNSFKNAHVPQYSDQWYPIFGAEKSIVPASDYHNTTISYDFYAPAQGGSDFEFALYSINEANQEFDIVLALGFENRGYIYLYPELNFGGFTYAEQGWQANTWYNVRIEVREETIKFYLNNELMLDAPNNAKVNIDGMTLLHNNYGGDAYYDNIKVNETMMAVNSVTKGKIAVYPNPVKNNLNLNLPAGEQLASIKIYNVAGQQVLTKDTTSGTLSVEHLKTGVYMVTAITTKGISYTSKFIKE